jgi:hypothetical protein
MVKSAIFTGWHICVNAGASREPLFALCKSRVEEVPEEKMKV